MKYRVNQSVRINDAQSPFHRKSAIVARAGRGYYDVEVSGTGTLMRVVPEQLLARTLQPTP